MHANRPFYQGHFLSSRVTAIRSKNLPFEFEQNKMCLSQSFEINLFTTVTVELPNVGIFLNCFLNYNKNFELMISKVLNY